MSKPTASWWCLSLINLVVLLLILQIIGWFAEPKLSSRLKRLLTEDAVIRGLHYEDESVKRPHPYFGYIPAEKRSFETAEKFRAPRTEGLYRIGIFGGSTAEMFFEYNDRSQFFLRELKKLPHLRGKKIEIWNFSLGGYRQPQALNIAALYGDRLDLALNIEGHNELAYRFPDGSFPPYYPLQAISHAHFSEPGAQAWFQKGVGHGQALRSLSQKLKNEPSIWRVMRMVDYLRFFYHARQVQSWYLDEPQFKRPFQSLTAQEEDRERLRLWLKASCQQKNLLLSQGVDQLFFLQPIPWRRGLEKQRRQPDYPPQVWLNAGYDAFLALQSGQYSLAFTDLHKPLRDLAEDVFVDSCCHVNERGNELLTQVVIHEIGELLANPEDQRKPCQIKDLLKAPQL